MALPSGTVPFLFTDIESSSAQWEADPPDMHAAVQRHDEILREVIEAGGGVVFKQVGDGVPAAFSTAGAALAAAVDGRQRLQDERWPLADRLRIRMGLHTGVVTPIGDDYLGPAVNRVARVMAAANGDQIVWSVAAAALCPELRFRDAGQHLLAGVGPERLFVLQTPGGDADTQPLRSALSAPTNLATEATSFIGRAAEVKPSLSTSSAAGPC